MTDRKDMNASPHLGGSAAPDESLTASLRDALNTTDDPQQILARESGVDHRNADRDKSGLGLADNGDAKQCQGVAEVISDVEGFARSWIGRIGQIIRRSSQLIEREELLSSAVSRQDLQEAEWIKRTTAKEEGLREQSKRLTQAWLEVESQRRKAIQGARAATAGKRSHTGAVIFAPVRPIVGGQPVQHRAAPAVSPPAGPAVNPPVIESQVGTSPMPPTPPATNANAPPAGNNASLTSEPRQNGPVQNRAVQNNAVPQSVPLTNAPVATGHLPSDIDASQRTGTAQHSEAATRQKIDEFRRMQRAIRSHRNK